MPDDLIAAAAASNAQWCQSMALAHGMRGVFGTDVWTCPTRTPRYYPDAVTLTPHATSGGLLDYVDDSPGCSVKDSYQLLDLSSHGYGELLTAQWIHRPDQLAPPDIDDAEQWVVIDSDDDLAVWEQHLLGEDDSSANRLFPSGLLHDPSVAIVAGYRSGELVGGAVLNHDDAAASLSNVFNLRAQPVASWAGALRVAARICPQVPLFGWETGDYLRAPGECGFAPIGPLRVWWRQA